MLTYRVLRFLRHQGIFIGILFGVALTAGVITGVTILTFFKPRIEVRTQIQERIVVVSSTPAAVRSSPTVVPTIAAPTVVPTTAPPAPTTVPATPSPPPLTPAGSVLRFGELWQGQGMTLRSLGGPDNVDVHGCCVRVRFEARNQTGNTLNFEVPSSSFYLELSTGKRYSGAYRDVRINDFKPGSTIGFLMWFELPFDTFQEAKRGRNVQYYTVVVQGFNDRIPVAKWREAVAH